jgi:hypothetical protein
MASQTRIIDLSGDTAFFRKLKSLGDRATTIVSAALLQEAEAIMTESKQQCPVDTGALRASGHVTPPEISGGHVAVTLAYGGPAAPYAIFVHEKLTARHPIGKAKYLEDPLLGAVNGIEARLGAMIRKGIESALG